MSLELAARQVLDSCLDPWLFSKSLRAAALERSNALHADLENLPILTGAQFDTPPILATEDSAT